MCLNLPGAEYRLHMHIYDTYVTKNLDSVNKSSSANRRQHSSLDTEECHWDSTVNTQAGRHTIIFSYVSSFCIIKVVYLTSDSPPPILRMYLGSPTCQTHDLPPNYFTMYLYFFIIFVSLRQDFTNLLRLTKNLSLSFLNPP